MSTFVATYPDGKVKKLQKQKPRIAFILSLRESMRRGERAELRQDYNLSGTRVFTVLPTTDPWSRPLQSVPISAQSGDILILVNEGNQGDIWDVFQLLGSMSGWSHALLNPEFLGYDWERYVARIVAGAGKVG